jgi:hypothetical protein
MLIPPQDFDFVVATPTAHLRVSVGRVAGLAISLILHLALLMQLTLPIQRYPRPALIEEDRPAMNLVLLEPDAAPAAPVQMVNTEVAAVAPKPVRKPTQTQVVFIEPARRDARVDDSAARGATVDAPRLFNGIEAAAAEIVAADPRLPNAGMPSALGRVPGRAEPFVHLPLVHREGGSMSRALAALGRHMIVGELDDNPLRSSADRAARGGPEPVCNDPENPLADERCWLPPEQ